MSDNTGTFSPDLLVLTAKIVSAHAKSSRTEATELPDLIRAVYGALADAGSTMDEPPRREPAVPVKRSVFPDYIICLEDGCKLKLLKRHLARHFGLTPAAYRAKWGLPSDYPMVAPSYSERRSVQARKLGLGKAKQAPGAAVEVAVQQVAAGKSGLGKGRGRPRKDAAAT